MSSGQPYKKPSDVQMYRNEYLNDLEMRKDLDKINYDANMNYIKTGALPPQSQMSDNRTVNDKLLDLVYVKKHIIDTLSPLSNQKYAENVVEALLSNPNNVDNKLLIFTAQRAPEIAEQLKKIYSIGIKGNLDDSMKLVSYILKLFRVQHNSMLSLREVQNRFTSDKVSQPSLLAALHNIILQIIAYMEYMMREKSNIPFYNELRKLKILLSFIPDQQGNIEFDINGQKIHTEMRYMKNYITGDNNTMIYMASKYMAFLNSDFPNIDDLNYLFKEIIKAFETWRQLKNRENKKKLYDKLMNIYNILYNEDIVFRLKEFENVFETNPSLAREMRELSPSERTASVEQENDRPLSIIDEMGDVFSYPSSDNTVFPDLNSEQSVPDLEPNDLPGWAPIINNETGTNATIQDAIDDYLDIVQTDYDRKEMQVLITYFKRNYGISFEDFSTWYQNNNNNNENNLEPSPPPPPQPSSSQSSQSSQSSPPPPPQPSSSQSSQSSPPQPSQSSQFSHLFKDDDNGFQIYGGIFLSEPELLSIFNDYNNMAPNPDPTTNLNFKRKHKVSYNDFKYWYENIYPKKKGNGFKRGRGRPRGNGVVKPYKQTISENLNTDKGLEESRRFVKFGKYLINMNKLNDNILSLKIPSGGTVVGHPVTKITSSFSKIVKNMINNVSPSFKDLQSLSDTEKNYLYNISKKANILDKFSIPTPDMSEDDKDINEYEILKGEILAGNDNKDLIKKFKAKIVKMSNKGLLNKKDVSSILHDLLNLNL